MRKVILISIDGMRPDGWTGCGHPFVERMMSLGSYALDARTVFPSVTLPCHLSLFHSVVPQRHGVLSNQYLPFVHPVKGLFELIADQGLDSAMFYGWEPLRDVSRPGSLRYAEFIHSYSDEHTDALLTDRALACIRAHHSDFVFLYMVETDEKGGHDNGWMTEAYLQRIAAAIDNVRRVYEQAGDEYTILVTADHGGHDRMHGTDSKEDMTIPICLIGPGFAPARRLKDVSILDLAPTVASCLELHVPKEWEGKSLL
ncbi:MAG: alkaline phosphatase family protein [Clostridia bacterium]|nr:alkaline phosphatase family protein [Clostridia bacterium]